jgi:hypothetical protein
VLFEDGVQRLTDGFALDLKLPLTVGDGAELRGDLDGDRHSVRDFSYRPLPARVRDRPSVRGCSG